MADAENVDRLLSVKMMVELTGLSESFFRVGWCQGRLKLPFLKLGKAVRVKHSEYIKWLDENSSGSAIKAGAC